MEEKNIYKELIKNLTRYSFPQGRNKKFIVNLKLFNVLRDNIESLFPFTVETSRDVLIKRHYYARIPIVVDKYLEDDFLLVKEGRYQPIVIDLRVNQLDKEKDKNESKFLLQDLPEYLQNFPNVDLGIIQEKGDKIEYNILSSKEDLLIGKVILFKKEIEELRSLKYERLVWNFTPLKILRVLSEIQKHKDHFHNIDICPNNYDFSLTCFDCKKRFGTGETSFKELKKKLPHMYLSEENRGYFNAKVKKDI